MQTDLTLPLAFLAGLAGAGHCWAMCGGLAGGLFLHAGGGHRLFSHLGYHAGRVLAYTLLGALAAGIGQAIVLTGGVGRAQGVLYIVAGVLVVLAGAWTLRRPPGCGGCSTATSPRHPALFTLAGFLNGLMPCALVFSLTLKAATAPTIATGAAWLFVFGLGTVPAMALVAGLAHWLVVRSAKSMTLNGVFFRHASLHPLAVYPIRQRGCASPDEKIHPFHMSPIWRNGLLGVQALLWLRRAAAVFVIALGLQAIWAGAKFFHVMLHL